MSISSGLKEFKDIKELEEYSNKQFMMIEALRQENKELKEKLSQSEKALASMRSNQFNDDIDELAIAEMQLQRLKEVAMQRMLSLEETRMYDLLVKNKKASKPEEKDVTPAHKTLTASERTLLLEAAKESNE